MGVRKERMWLEMSRVSLYLNWNRRWFQFEIDYRVVEKELNETSHNLMHQQMALQTILWETQSHFQQSLLILLPT